MLDKSTFNIEDSHLEQNESALAVNPVEIAIKIADMEIKARNELLSAINFDNIKCNKSINIYKNMFFKYNDEMYDFNIESQKELDIIIAYYEKGNIKKSTIEFKIDFDFGESCLDEITKAYQNNSLTANISYINIADNFMLIKG